LGLHSAELSRTGTDVLKDLRIIAAQTADLEWFETLAREAMAPYYEEQGMPWHGHAFRASLAGTENYRVELAGAPAGMLRYARDAAGLFVHDLHLQPQMRGRGIGAALLRLIEARARALGATAVRMRVVADNPALRLYERLGYARVAEEQGWLRLELRLADGAPTPDRYVPTGR
jgi:GNAT superfamily N-acetyltransferase